MGSFSDIRRASSDECSDPVLLALRLEHDAQQSYADAVNELDRAGAFSGDLLTQGDVLWRLYKLEDLETAKTEAWQRLLQAEKCVLDTKPTSLKGSLALLCFVRNHLNDYPKLMPVIGAISNVDGILIELSSSDRNSGTLVVGVIEEADVVSHDILPTMD